MPMLCILREEKLGPLRKRGRVGKTAQLARLISHKSLLFNRGTLKNRADLRGLIPELWKSLAPAARTA